MYSTGYTSQILMKFEFSLDRFSKNTETYNFINIFPVGADMFHTDGRTDRQTKRTDGHT